MYAVPCSVRFPFLLVGSLLISVLVIFPALSSMRLFRSFKSVTVCSAVLSVAIVAVQAAAFALCCLAGRVFIKRKKYSFIRQSLRQMEQFQRVMGMKRMILPNRMKNGKDDIPRPII